MTDPLRQNASIRLSAGGLALALAGALSVAPALAVTCDPANFSGASQCAGPVPGGPGGNVTPEQMNAGEGLFDILGWNQLARIGSVTASGTQDAGLFSFTYTDGGQGGSWTLNPDYLWDEGAYAFVFKGATDNVVYLIEGGATAGTWTVADLDLPGGGNGRGNGRGNGGGASPDLSNVTLFGTAPPSLRDTPPAPPQPDTPAPIPLPAAGLLMLGGLGALGGLVALRRKRKAA
jgi:hypothetical protein